MHVYTQSFSIFVKPKHDINEKSSYIKLKVTRVGGGGGEGSGEKSIKKTCALVSVTSLGTCIR